ncbi:MAG: N-6 DNA methylase [Actinomycetota bacterium]|nr:N-6 DNA methylase [Actinomycetota bacterium]
MNEVTARAWERVKAYWAAFRAGTESLGIGETGITETRELWLLPLFRELGYGRLVYRQTVEEIDGHRYAISHQAGDGGDAPPVHLVSLKQELDRPAGATAGQPRTSPHGVLQEYLSRTEHLWGIVANGKRLRLLRDNQSLSRAAYIEFDLEAMLEGGVYADFGLLYLTAHRSRLPALGQPVAACWLERWREVAEERGARALDELRSGVEAAIRALGQGLLEHPENAELREKLVSGKLSILGYYRQLLRLVYRFLFLLAAEERELLFESNVDPARHDIYRRHYGLSRLRQLVEQRRHADRHDDLWRSLRITFAALRDEETTSTLGLKPLGGGLFGTPSCPDLDGALIANGRLLEAVRGLSFTGAGQGEVVRRVNYRDMDVEELGSVYEGLLDLEPVLMTIGERPSFELGASGERRSSGAYYTNPGLVRELITSALEPTIEKVLRSGHSVEEKRGNLLGLKICDPACGSGHFLLAAARRIGWEVARLDAGGTEPDPETTREGVREAVHHCVYGVDLNPLAVDLCKLALWLEGHTPGKPLGFLDHHIKHGNSVVGATTDSMEQGIREGV